jgi:hypothetical protein
MQRYDWPETLWKGSSMVPYQLGIALVQNTERIVVHSQTIAHDLRALLSSTHLWHALALEPVEPPASLMQMMDQWPYWQAFLSQVVDYVFAPGVTDEFPGRLQGGRRPSSPSRNSGESV